MSEKEKTPVSEQFGRVYDDATFFIDNMMQDYDVFPTILSMMRDGNASIELKKRYILRAIDETWVNVVEDTLPALDVIIRNPSKYIEEREEVMPIELSRNISVRSLQHLSQHTNYISKVEGDKITPTKILNVFREETMQTYENKFVNTLINRLFAFVNRRYEIAAKAGQDEKTTSLEFKEDFYHGEARVKLNFRMEIAEPAMSEEDRVERNYTHTTDLWRRVVKLNDIVTTYANSTFVQEMGKSYIRPPVMRTNAILKNKNLRQCLALWQFIESYDNAGYSMLVQEDLEKVDDAYVKELYSTLALQYLIFRYNIRNEFEADATLADRINDDVYNPRIISELSDPDKDEFDVPSEPEKVPPTSAAARYVTLTPEDMLMLRSLDVALAAVDKITEEEEDILDHPSIPEPEPAPEYVEPDEKAEEEDEASPVQGEVAQSAGGVVQDNAQSASEADNPSVSDGEPSSTAPLAQGSPRELAAKRFNELRDRANGSYRRRRQLGREHLAAGVSRRREALDRLAERRRG
ncbi:MAG: DUF2357 domain-containing protein [Clostridia bacterium]|nr:DUF2357 domain-containing protein [Clostridia bacterium]